MTKTEFIDAYGTASKLMQWRVQGGFDVGTRKLRAFPCDCDSDMCQGWQMIHTTDLDDQSDIVKLYKLDLSSADEE